MEGHANQVAYRAVVSPLLGLGEMKSMPVATQGFAALRADLPRTLDATMAIPLSMKKFLHEWLLAKPVTT